MSFLCDHNALCSHVDGNRPSNLIILTVEHAAPFPKLSVPFKRSLGTGFTFGQLFLSPRLVGMLRVFDMETLDIIAFNRITGACRVIHTDTLYVSCLHLLRRT